MTSLLLACFLAAAPAGSSWTVDPVASTVRYRVVHKLHQVAAASARIEGKAVVQPGGRVLAMLRAPIASFDSGDRNRDAYMLEVLEVSAFPFVVVKISGALPADPPGAAAAAPPLKLRLEGEVDLHGVKQPFDVALDLELRPDGSARARGAFDVSLEAHRFERPSMLFVKVEDRCRIELDLVLRGGRREADRACRHPTWPTGSPSLCRRLSSRAAGRSPWGCSSSPAAAAAATPTLAAAD